MGASACFGRIRYSIAAKDVIATRTRLAYAGRGALNLAMVLAVVLGQRVPIIGRVPDTLGLSLLCIALVASYLAGVRRRRIVARSFTSLRPPAVNI